MNSRRSVVPWWLLGLLAVFLLFSGKARAQALSPRGGPLPAEIHADQLERFENQHRVVARGNVEILYKGIRVRADTVEVDTETGAGKAVGHVLIEDGDNRITGDHADFNINSQLGVLYHASGYLGGTYHVSGAKIERLGPDRFRLYSGTMTSCQVNCPSESPPWHFAASRALIDVGQYAYLTGPSFWIKDVPVLYSPYLVWPIKNKRATGFLIPTPGVGSKDGIIYKHAFFWAINPSQDATFNWDYYSKRGLGTGLEYRIVPDRDGYGQIDAYHISDRLTGKTFWKLNTDQHQFFKSGLKEQLHLDMLTNGIVNQDFAHNLYDRSRQTAESFFSLSQSWGPRNLELKVSRIKSVDPNVVDIFGRYPQIVFNNSPEQIGSSPLYFEARASWDTLYRDLQGDKHKVGRLDLHPRVSVPLTRVPWLTVTPSLGIEDTWYSSGQNTSGSLNRKSVDFVTNLVGPKFSRIYSWGGDRVDRLKHLIEPSVTYTYIPAVDSEVRRKIVSLDAIDAVAPTNEVTYGITNRLLARVRQEPATTPVAGTKEAGKGQAAAPAAGGGRAEATESTEAAESFQTVEIARLTISQTYSFINSGKTLSADQQRLRSLSDITADGVFHPVGGGEIGLTAYYSPYDRKLDRWQIRSMLDIAPKWNVSLEKQWNRSGFEGQGPQEYWSAAVQGTFLDRWNLLYSNRYDGVARHSLEAIYQVEYLADCWSLAVRFDSTNNTNGGKQQKILFLFSLKDVLATGEAAPIGFSLGSG